MARTGREVHLPINLGDTPRAAALADALLGEIADGRLADHDWLPATRMLARQLSCSRSLVTAAYDELIAAGVLVGVPGSGTRVSEGAADAVRAGARSHVAGGVGAPDRDAASVAADVPTTDIDEGDLLPGRSDDRLIDSRAWRSCVRGAASMFGFAGEEALAAALQPHLRRHRGVAGDGLLVTATSTAAFETVARVARTSGMGRCIVETPCYRPAYQTFGDVGLTVTPVGVDEDGLRVDDLPGSRCLVYTTPAHQYPLGHRMSARRRTDLIAWALDTGSVIVEDDYDGEFRYDVAPLPALRALPGADRCVAYIGTSSKVLANGLNIAWLLPPSPLAESMRATADRAAWRVAQPTAGAIARFVSGDHLATHLARVGRVYRDRRNALVGALAATCPEVDVLGVEAGLHVTVLIEGHDDRQVRDALADRGLSVAALSDYPFAGRMAEPGLVVGYARASPTLSRRLAVELAAILRSNG